MAIPDLNNKHVLVTGAATGIGQATALAFARHGASLLLSDINATALETTAQQVRALGACCRTFVVDVTDASAMARFAADVHAAVGPLDVLVNNAGIAYLGPFVHTPLDWWHKVVQVNLMGVVHGCHFFLPAMLGASGPRHVVNVASAAALAPACNMSAYAASKHAVLGLSDSLALEHAASQVGFSVICPGVINTPIAAMQGGNVARVISAGQVERLGQYYRDKGAPPDVVADAIIDAVRRGKSMALPGPYARLIYHLRRLSRTVLMKLILIDSKKMGWL
ncbi:SDR family NAD(P)-dependent oxidoreductase [Duganella sp. LX20W]|uniref:SDR family NAD(P)-dependent oxidoreductase n=1 Tax=Rugamonas brunnea TaxID=2758569 RepID=A0A7W2ICW3_9BURK|nr:SDR family NAD(P)-dependent oxidoreductase [Rugamonas brunnea]MBA5638966.1 SDR family NAD(P)-dependent oxidoreductase [Rugamonas brunnea]